PWYWFKQAGYVYKYAGENLAVGFVDSKTVYDAWFNSPSHKANLLNKNYTQVGTAIVSGFDGNSIVVVQEFGRPLATTVASNPKPETPASSAGKLNPKQTTTPKVESPKPETVQPTPEPVQETPSSTVSPRVLSESTEYIVGPEYAGTNS